MPEKLVSLQSEVGVKELKEAVEAVLEIGLRIAAALKDGFQPSDLTILFDLFSKDEVLKKKIHDAYDGISKVSGEVKDIHVKEGVEISIALIQYVPKFIELFSKAK